MQDGLTLAQDKMRGAGLSEAAIEVFSHYYAELQHGQTGLIPESSIDPLTDVPRLSETTVDPEAGRAALAQTAVLRLNGGLGTSMGMHQAKSLLPVRDGLSFLDLIVRQIAHARVSHGIRLPLIFMNSFRTRDDTLSALEPYPALAVDGLPMDFLQNAEPKVRCDDLTPVEWPADPALEWCPPGHGDVFTVIHESGLLDELLTQGFRYLCSANADNLGAAPDARIAGWFAETGAPYAAEVCERTPADRKGGHLALRRSDGRLILRDTAQTPAEDMEHFTDEHRHPFFHTNNLWFDLEALRDALTERGPVLGLPLIRNTKTVDPTDPQSPQVYQLETAIGAAVEVFDGARAIVVGRERFLPVKTTNDLLLLRSDVYAVEGDGVPRLTIPTAPTVDLDPDYYKKISDFDARFPEGPPSLRRAESLTVRGDWTFGADVVVTGVVSLTEDGGIANGDSNSSEGCEGTDSGASRQIPDGQVL